MTETFHIQPRIFKQPRPTVKVVTCNEQHLSAAFLSDFLETCTGGVIGVSPAYGALCELRTIAFASPEQVIVLHLTSHLPSRKKRKGRQQAILDGRELLCNMILCDPGFKTVAIRMDRLAASLFLDFDLRIRGGIDLLSPAKGERHSLEAFMTALGGELLLDKAEALKLFNYDERSSTSDAYIAEQAWAAYQAGVDDLQRLNRIPPINTADINAEHLAVLAKTLRDQDRLMALRPTQVKNEVETSFNHKQGKLHVTCSRFKTRVMPTSTTQTLQIETENNGKRSTVAGRTSKVNGRSVEISLNGAFRGKLCTVTTIGREDPTSAEGQREKIILNALQRANTILKHPFVQSIWLPAESPSSTVQWRSPSSLHFPSRPLNPSQIQAVEALLDQRSITLIHGPPGTGKTTVIAATVTSVTAADQRRTIWLLAQSNVAVKNIAEKLASVNFLDFKLLVSKDFHFDWHEHLYHKVERNVIRSDDFVDDAVATSRLLLGSRVILCTLSMMSNYRLATFSRLVPVETVIVDEASQIEVGDYFPLLFRFQKTLRKLAFIGDDKQLAPYGQDDLGDLRSIFEMTHLRAHAVFLDTQYRMPVPIGRFISQHVYDNKLKTEHSIQSPKSCWFVDVSKGLEQRRGPSLVNINEARVVTKIARKYAERRLSFRIITPYDAQRNLLENFLKVEDLPWEDKCFNVDSFQGNEEDHIIISLVRTDKIGFLKEKRRVNVMLTRCKKGMVICTSKAFLETTASTSLVAELAKALGSKVWVDARKVLYGNWHG